MFQAAVTALVEAVLQIRYECVELTEYPRVAKVDAAVKTVMKMMGLE
jgi:hypothetical protein